MTWRVWWRGLRHEWVLVVALTTATLVGAASVTAAPRVLELASERDLRHTVATAEPDRRNIAVSVETRIVPASGDPLAYIGERDDRYLRDSFPEEVSAVVASQQFVVDSPPFRVTSYPDGRSGPFPTTFRFRIQEGIEDESRLVEGALPRPHDPILEYAGTECPTDPGADDDFQVSDDVDCRIVEVPVIETALTRQTADDMGVGVGDLVTLTPNQVDLRWALAGVPDLRIALRISGLVELSDVGDEYWFADNRLHRARVTENADVRLVDATGLLARDQYPLLFADVPRVGFDTTWRLFVDPARIEVDRADGLATALANVDLHPVEVRTGLPELVSEYQRQRDLVLALLATVVAGLIVVVATVLSAVAVLLALRSSGASALITARGASRRQLLTGSLRTASFAAVPATAVGAMLAWSLFRSTSSTTPSRLAGLFGVAIVLTVVVALRTTGPRPMRSLRRVVAETTFVVGATGAALAVRRRGDLSVSGVAEFDTLMAITPSLIIASAALLLVRLVTPSGRALARLVEPRRGIVAFVGFRQLVARPAAARIGTGAMVVAIGVAVFAASLTSSIATAREASSWYEVGAEATVAAEQLGVPLPTALDDAIPLDGVLAARRVVVPGATVEDGDATARVDIVAIDAARYAELIGGAPIERPPLGLVAEAPPSAPTALVSTSWPRGATPMPGADLRLDLGPGEIDVSTAATVDSFPGVAAGRPFVVVDLSAVEDAGLVMRPGFLHLADDDPDVLARIASVPRTRVLLRGDVTAALSADPLSNWTVRLLRWVTVLGVAFAVVAVLTTIAISVLVRGRDLVVLRTLGLEVRQGSAMTLLEHLPSLLVASFGGVVSGSMTAWLLRSALGLARFAGPGRPAEVRLDLGATLATAGLVVVAMALSVTISVRVQRRRDVAATLRVGEA